MDTPSGKKNEMNPQTEQDGFIPGIYNYCDRWCEKCRFTSRCRNYAFDGDSPSAEGPEIWDYLQNIFKATSLMLDEIMVRMGAQPSEISYVLAKTDEYSQRHSILLKAGKITSDMHEWLEKNENGIKINIDKKLYNKRDNSGISFAEAIEVINWYMFFIPAKIARALSEHHQKASVQEQFIPEGSAKIALIAIDRIIGAWTLVMNQMPEFEDEILKILIDLSSLRKQTESAFPLARDFVRPGFDEE